MSFFHFYSWFYSIGVPLKDLPKDIGHLKIYHGNRCESLEIEFPALTPEELSQYELSLGVSNILKLFDTIQCRQITFSAAVPIGLCVSRQPPLLASMLNGLMPKRPRSSYNCLWSQMLFEREHSPRRNTTTAKERDLGDFLPAYVRREERGSFF